MNFSYKWQKAFDSRDKNEFEDLVDDDFAYVRHLSGKVLDKKEILNVWLSDGPRPERRSYRIIYEADDILVSHAFIHFPIGDKESVLVVMLLKNGNRRYANAFLMNE